MGRLLLQGGHIQMLVMKDEILISISMGQKNVSIKPFSPNVFQDPIPIIANHPIWPTRKRLEVWQRLNESSHFTAQLNKCWPATPSFSFSYRPSKANARVALPLLSVLFCPLKQRLMSISSTNSLVLSNTDTDILLSLLEWRYAVTPTGELAPQPAMMGNRRPVCHLVKREDRFVTEITTQSNWTRNLVQNDVLWGNINTDFDALQILAQCKMLFPHMMNELPLASPRSSVRKILHLVQCETKAHFSLVNVMRLVKSFEQKLRTAVASWPENKQSCYEALDKIFCLYGFLVPTKITLGK